MNGILIIDKPAGLTSHDVVARVRRGLSEKRVGHTGTLDPFATGVLVLLIGRATRLAQFLNGAEKEYEAAIRFGYRTDTGDATGKRIDDGRATDDAHAGEIDAASCAFDEDKLEAALATLRGAQEQMPPMYSAKKIAGRKLYELARRGEEVARQASSIFVREFVALPRDDESLFTENPDGTRDVRARVTCSAGTYVRVLAEDLGARLNTPAHLAALRRTRAGAFTLGDAVTLDELSALAATGDAATRLLPVAAALPAMPFVHLTIAEVADVRHGRLVRASLTGVAEGSHVRLLAGDGELDAELIAVGVYDSATGRVQPRALLIPSANEVETNR